MIRGTSSNFQSLTMLATKRALLKMVDFLTKRLHLFMRWTFLAALLLICGPSRAQVTAFADSSAQWIYITYTSEFPWDPSYDENQASRYFIWGDSLIEDVLFAKMYVDWPVYNLTPSTSSAQIAALLREESGRVYFKFIYPSAIGAAHGPIVEFGEILMFDYSAGVGDTIVHGIQVNPFSEEVDSVYSVVTATDSIFEDGVWYRAYNAEEFRSTTYPSGEWSQSMDGSVYDLKREPFGSAHNGLFGPFMPYYGLNQITWLSCFHSESFQYSSETWATCLNVSIPKTPESENCMVIKGSLIELNCGPGQARVSVTNTMGQIVYSATLSQNENLDLSHLLKGVYVLSMESKTFSTSKKVAVID
jgi:hypothetical protein